MSGWPANWYAIDGEPARVLGDELRKELAKGHGLYGADFRVVARCNICDDVLAELADGQVAQVHLTWCSGADTPPFPLTERWPSHAEWLAHRAAEPEHDPGR
jgi:hypothetical protein